MDPSFFGLDGHPFARTGDATEAFLSESHRSLLTELRAGLNAPHGITLLIGDAGSGKTALARRFATAAAEECAVAYLPNTGPGLRHLLTEAIEQLGGSPPTRNNETDFLDALAKLARARAAHGRATLVVVDDAHELPAKTIERLGRLFGDDPAEPSMLHVILVGRPELLDRMNAANDRTILKHLVQVCRMDPIGPEECFRYIADRIARVGGVVDRIFTQDALRLIVKRANGNPSRIDAICSAALQQAAERGQHPVGAETVDLACMGVEGFSMDGAANGSGERNMQYVFGEDPILEDDPSEVRAAEATKSRAEKMPTNTRRPGERRHGEVSSRLDAVLGPASGSRRQLVLWGVGLVAVLVGFTAVMTRSGDDAQATAQRDRTVTASVPASNTGSDAGGPKAQLKSRTTKPLPATAASAPRLVVKREGKDATPVVETTRKEPPVHASPATAETAPARTEAAPARASRPIVVANASPQNRAATAERSATSQAGATPTAPAGPAVTGASVPTGASAEKQAAAAQAKAPREVSANPQTAASTNVRRAPAQAQVARATKPVGTPTVSAGARYTVQIGAFKSRTNAEALLAKVKRSYPDGRIVTASSGSSPVYRVVSGAFASKADADQRARTLAENGFSTYIRPLTD